ncbi:MAG: hypothetical protein ACOC2N_01705 [Spirochaetota bacterium]
MIVHLPDQHALVAASRLLNVKADALEQFVEIYRSAEGWIGPQFCIRGYREAVILLARHGYNVAESTLRNRVRRGVYIEGKDYVRKGPRRVVFSRAIIQFERER